MKQSRDILLERPMIKELQLKTIPKPFLKARSAPLATKKTFKSPISPDRATLKYAELLTDADMKDINKFNEIYFLSKTRFSTTLSNSGVVYYSFVESAHIAYRYETLKFIGRGSFGTVIKCFDHKEQKLVAIKLMYNDQMDKNQVDLEVNFLKKLSVFDNGAANHHTVSLLDSFVFRSFTCIVTDLYERDLYSYIKSKHFTGIDMEEVRTIGGQIADAMAFTHSAKIVHSDLKPENIMFNDASKTSVTIIDFGCSCNDRQPIYRVVQSLYYRSPEVIFHFKYGTEIDVWSFGCILYELATGRPLFHAKDEKQLIEQITTLVGEPPLEMIERSKKMKKYFDAVPANRAACEMKKKRILAQLLPKACSELVDVIADCICWLPAKRPTMKQILEYPFFRN